MRDGGGQVRRAVLTADKAMLQVTRLAALNAQGHDITVRPMSGLASGLVVLDDLDAAGLRRLRDDGHAPVVVTGATGATGTMGTTDGRYQVWLRLSTDEVDPQVAARAARDLQHRYGPGEDRALAHVGPLAGFVDHPLFFIPDDHTGTRGARGETDGAAASLVTVQGAGDAPGRVTPTATRVLAVAEERVEARRATEAHEQEQNRGGDGSARWGGRLVEAFATELGRDDEPAGTADSWQRRRRRPGIARADDEHDGRGGR